MKIFVCYFLSLAFIFSTTLSECNHGCLSCKSGDCNVCNMPRGYHLDSTTKSCIYSPVSNCKRISAGFCLQCDSGYYPKSLNANSNEQCALVEHDIKNCITYKSKNACSICKEGFHPSEDGSTCVKFKKAIEHCVTEYETVQGDIKCEICKNGYVLTANQTECRKFERDNNCLVASNFYCNKCKKGFGFRNPLRNDMRNEPGNYHWADNLQNIDFEPYKQSSISQCVNIIESCAVYQTISNDEETPQIVCKTCQPRHYLAKASGNSTKCIPTSSVANCEIYKDKDTCLYCQSKFYLKNNECIESKTNLQFCKYYKNETACEVCMDGFKLYIEEDDHEISGKIAKLNETIKTIKSLMASKNKKNKETRMKLTKQLENNDVMQYMHLYVNMEELKHLTNKRMEEIEKKLMEEQKNMIEQNGLHEFIEKETYKPPCVISMTENCKKYLLGNCVECLPGYYLKENVCISVEKNKLVENCEKYNEDLNCTRCRSGYILYNNLCFRMNEMHNCDEMGFDDEGVCLLCKAGYYYDTKEMKCVEDSQLKEANCLIFNSLEHKNCYLCDTNSYMDSSEKCVPESNQNLDNNSQFPKTDKIRLLM